MMRLFGRKHKPGTPPGTLVSDEVTHVKASANIIAYSQDNYEETKTESMEECFQRIDKQKVTWIRVIGTKDAEALSKLGESFGFHPLALEDVMNGGQRPKAEDFGDYIFITIKLPIKAEARSSIRMEQVNIFLGPSYVLTIDSVA